MISLHDLYKKWDAFDVSDDEDEDAPKVALPSPRNHGDFPTSVLLCDGGAKDGDFPHYHDWKLVNTSRRPGSDFVVLSHADDASRSIVQLHYASWLPCYDGLERGRRSLLVF